MAYPRFQPSSRRTSQHHRGEMDPSLPGDGGTSRDTRRHLSAVVAHVRSVLTHVRPVVPHVRSVLTHVRSVLTHVRPVVPHVRPVLAHVRSVFAHVRPVLAHVRPVLAHVRSVLAHVRSVLAHVRSVLAHVRSVLAHSRSSFTHPRPHRGPPPALTSSRREPHGTEMSSKVECPELFAPVALPRRSYPNQPTRERRRGTLGGAAWGCRQAPSKVPVRSQEALPPRRALCGALRMLSGAKARSDDTQGGVPMRRAPSPPVLPTPTRRPPGSPAGAIRAALRCPAAPHQRLPCAWPRYGSVMP